MLHLRKISEQDKENVFTICLTYIDRQEEQARKDEK